MRITTLLMHYRHLCITITKVGRIFLIVHTLTHVTYDTSVFEIGFGGAKKSSG